MNDTKVELLEREVDALKLLFKRRPILCILLVIWLFAPALYAGYQGAQGRSMVQKNERLKEELADTRRERDKFDIKLASFQAAADAVFPDRERGERLDLLLNRLSDQIESISKWTPAFQPLNQVDAGRFVIAVKALAVIASNTTIRVQCEAGSTTRRQYGQQLGAMLSAAGVGHFASGTIVGFSPEGQMVCLYPADRESFVREFLKVLGSWTVSQVTMKPVSQGGMITIHINGTPSFDASGKVKMM